MGKPLISDIQLELLRYVAIMSNFRAYDITVSECMIVGSFIDNNAAEFNRLSDKGKLPDDVVKQAQDALRLSLTVDGISPKQRNRMVDMLRTFLTRERV